MENKRFGLSEDQYLRLKDAFRRVFGQIDQFGSPVLPTPMPVRGQSMANALSPRPAAIDYGSPDRMVGLGQSAFAATPPNTTVVPKTAPTDIHSLNLTPQEEALYQRHLTNLRGPGGVDNPDGSRSTLFQASVERDGKTYNIPTVWDGKILPVDEAVKRVAKIGWDKFPSYGSQQEAEARYQKMHDFMEKDAAAFLKERGSKPSLPQRNPRRTGKQASLNLPDPVIVDADGDPKELAAAIQNAGKQPVVVKNAMKYGLGSDHIMVAGNKAKTDPKAVVNSVDTPVVSQQGFIDVMKYLRGMQ